MHIMFGGFLAASCMGEETVCVNKKSDVNENFYSVHTLIYNYTDKGCMTCGEKQDLH